jgi:hypothetical protein
VAADFPIAMQNGQRLTDAACNSIQLPVNSISPRRKKPHFLLEPGLNDIRCTAHAWRHPNGTGRAIPGTSSALHASVGIFDFSLSSLYQKHGTGTNDFTYTALHTSFGVELQRRNAWKYRKRSICVSFVFA